MIGDEFNEIMTNGEFSEPLIAIYNDIEYDIRGTLEHSWKRKEVDGVLTIELPRKMTTFLISKNSLPSIVLSDNKLSNLKFKVDNILWKTNYVIGDDLLSFTVSVDDDFDTIETEEVVVDTDMPNLVM